MTRLAALLAVLLGVVAWEAVVPAGSRKEAWDLPVYWQISYPAMLAGSLALGWLAPDRPWRWGLLVGLGQGVWSISKLTLQSGVPTLWPLGLATFAILSLPCIALAYLGAWLGRALRS
jgi:hypothetical protein